VALARLLDGRVSVIGTHTHVRPLTSRFSPAAPVPLRRRFTGPHDSVIGPKLEPIINAHDEHAAEIRGRQGRVLLQGALVEIDDRSGGPAELNESPSL